MMAALWIKLSVDVLTDPKLAGRSAAERWLWIGLLCLAKQHAPSDGVLRYDGKALAAVLNLGVSAAKVDLAIDHFCSVGMLERTGDGLKLINWVRHQGDPSNAERQSRFRNGKVTEESDQLALRVTESGVTLPLPEVDKSKSKSKTTAVGSSSAIYSNAVYSNAVERSAFASLALASWPDSGLKPQRLWTFEQAAIAACPGVDLCAELRTAVLWEAANPQKIRPNKLRFFGNWIKEAQMRVGKQERNGWSERPGAHVQAPEGPRIEGRKILPT